ncbi:MAG: hydroxyethylthiazole kinase [Eubacteriaceae bacterium]
MENNFLDHVKKNGGLVHCITNYVTVNDCANIILGSGGSPIMADDVREVEEITSICNALVINIGTLNERTVTAMIKAGKKANTIANPIILDPVGVGASKLRTETGFQLLEEIKFSVIRGNSSEIKTLGKGSGTTKGVDADVSDSIDQKNIEEGLEFGMALSKKLGAVIAMTGEIDLVMDDSKAYVIRNGHAMMSKVTGTGCMLSALIGAYCGANPDDLLDATAMAVATMGLAGEIAYKKMVENSGGTGSFRTYLLDEISTMTTEKLKEGIKIETKTQ